MIRLQKLVISGFKSFADKTEFVFDRNIVAFVGPNGCGKSNVVDAISWIFQGSGLKILRASEKQDLIFKGNDYKKAAGFAEVELQFGSDNGEDYSIKKRVYQSGEVQYYLNRNECRPKDVTDFLSAQNIVSPEYSIIAQGTVGRIILMKSEEKRELIEEAAGIKTIRNERAKTLADLLKAEENCRQVDILLGEIHSEKERLKDQAERAIKSKEMQKLCYDAEKGLMLLKYLKTEEQFAALEVSYTSWQERLNSLDREYADAEAQSASYKQKLAAQEESKTALKESIIKKEGEISNLEMSIALHQNRFEELNEQQRKIDREVESLSQKLSQLVNACNAGPAAKKEDLDSLYERLDEYDKKIAEQTKSALALTSEMADLKKKIAMREQESKALVKKEKDLIEGQLSTIFSVIFDLKQRLKTQDSRFRDYFENAGKLDIRITGHLKMLGDLSFIGEGQEGESTGHLSRDTVKTLANDAADLRDSWARLKELAEAIHTDSKGVEELFFSESSLFSQREDINRELEVIENALDELKDRLADCDREAGRLTENGSLFYARKSEVEKEIAKTEEQLKNAIQVRERNDSDRIETEFNLKNRREESAANAEKMEKVRQDAFRLLNDKDRVFAEKKELGLQLKEIEKAIDESAAGMASMQRRYDDYYVRRKELTEEKNSYQVNRAKLESQIETVRNMYFENYREVLSVERAGELIQPGVKESEFRNNIAESRRVLDELGDVNFLALEEYEEICKRYDFINRQKEDITGSAGRLKEIIATLDDRLRVTFFEAFSKINENFTRIFTSVFDGGNASLMLTDEENILEAGVELIIQPPGKKISNIDLLSGGEKAMSAISLLFALFLYKPSPFCILDEADAPLDENNVLRYRRLISEFAEHTQFLMISHNKLSLEIADVLYGITMEKEGISKVVSVKLENIEHAG